MSNEQNVPDAEIVERNKIVRKAALEFSQTGSIAVLATKAGVPYRTLSNALKTGKFSPSLALKLETVCKVEFIRKEVLCPDVFK
jgi:hypothetical protein